MSKKKLQKVLGIILSTVMVAGLAACGSENTQGTTASSETQQESAVTTPAPSEPSEKEPEVVVPTYPLDTDVTLSYWSMIKYNSAFSSADESPFHIGLEKNTGVDIEWEFPQDGVSGTQAFNLLLTQDELPDLIFATPTGADGEQYINEGLVWDLTEYLPKYAPDYWEFVNSDDSIRRCVTTESGKHFKFAFAVEDDFNITYMGLAIRQDWLDECGLKVPTNLEEWENVLVTFKDKYGATFSSPKLGFGMSSGTGARADKSAAWYLENNEVKFANTTDEYKAFLETMNKWLDEGLMDPDIFTNDNAAIRNKCVNNEVGAMYIGSGTFRNILADAESSGNGAKWVGVEHPVAKAGDPVTFHQTRQSRHTNAGCMISKDCTEEELIVALQFLNYGYSEEGFMYYNYGDEGVSYTLDANGNPQWTDLITKSEVGANTAYAYYSGMASSGPSLQAGGLVRLLNQGAAGEAIDAWIANTVTRKHLVPAVSMTTDENLAYTDKWAAIGTYVSENVNAFILGDKSFDEWNDYVSTLEKMGLEDCRKIQQAAYDRWLVK